MHEDLQRRVSKKYKTEIIITVKLTPVKMYAARRGFMLAVFSGETTKASWGCVSLKFITVPHVIMSPISVHWCKFECRCGIV